MSEEKRDVLEIPIPPEVRKLQHKAEEAAEAGLGHVVNTAGAVKEGARGLGDKLKKRREERAGASQVGPGDPES